MEHYSKIFGHSEDNINIKRKKCISTKRNDDTDTFDELEGRYRSNAGPFRALHMGVFQFLEGPTIIAVRPSRGPAQCRSARRSRMEDFFIETYCTYCYFLFQGGSSQKLTSLHQNDFKSRVRWWPMQRRGTSCHVATSLQCITVYVTTTIWNIRKM